MKARRRLTIKERVQLAWVLARIVRDFGMTRSTFTRDLKVVWKHLDKKECDE